MSVLLLLAVAAAGFFAYQTQNLVKQINEIKTVSTPTTKPSSTPDPTANWKTYTNDKYDFVFKYPSEYVVEERVPGFLIIKSPDDSEAQAGISLDSRLLGPYASYSKAKETYDKGYLVANTHKVGSWEVFSATAEEGMLKDVQIKIGLIGYKTGVLEVETLSNTKYEDAFDQILATFKFTNTESPTPTATSSSTPTN